jgi:hypothetical protein
MRLDLAVTTEEKRAAFYLVRLATAVQDAGYYETTSETVTPECRKALEKAYRVLRPACEFYTEDHGLVWEPGDGKFKKKVKP